MANPIRPSIELAPANGVPNFKAPSIHSLRSVHPRPSLKVPAATPWVSYDQVEHIMNPLRKDGLKFSKHSKAQASNTWKQVEQEAQRLVEAANSNVPVTLQWRGKSTADEFTSLRFVSLLKAHCLRALSVYEMKQGFNAPGPGDPGFEMSKWYADIDGDKINEIVETSPKELADSYRADGTDWFLDTIDYLTATFIRILAKTIKGTYWTSSLVAVAALVSACLKKSGQHLSPVAYDDPGRLPLHIPRLRGSVEIASCHEHTVKILRASIFQLPDDFATRQVPAIQSSLFTFESHITHEWVLVASEFDGAVQAGSQARTVEITQAAFHVCREAWELLRHSQPLRHTSDWVSTVEWRTSSFEQPHEHSDRRARLDTLESMVAALIPYSMSSGAFAAAQYRLENLCRYSLGGLTDNRLQLAWDFSVLYSARVRLVGEMHHVPGKLQSLVRNDVRGLHTRHEGLNFGQRLSELPKLLGPPEKHSFHPWGSELSRAAIAAAQKEYDSWVIDDNAIIVPYKWYAWGFLGIAATLVFAGLGIGLSLGERIPGVDPFNISVFCWAVAAFLLVVVKAVRVEHWSWNRFLRGEVACRSVTEVVSVTGMDPQALLVILLRLDDRMFLQTRGPFDAMFGRHTDDPQGGFSINVPMKASTAFEGGLVPIEVQGMEGFSLVFLRTHSWAPFNSVRHASTYEKGLICRDIEHPGSWAPDRGVPCYRLSRGDVYIVRVLGLFAGKCYLY